MKQTNQAEKIILGIDPGTNVMGYGVIRVVGNKAQLVVMGIIDMRKESDPYLRLGKIFEGKAKDLEKDAELLRRVRARTAKALDLH